MCAYYPSDDQIIRSNPWPFWLKRKLSSSSTHPCQHPCDVAAMAMQGTRGGGNARMMEARIYRVGGHNTRKERQGRDDGRKGGTTVRNTISVAMTVLASTLRFRGPFEAISISISMLSCASKPWLHFKLFPMTKKIIF